MAYCQRNLPLKDLSVIPQALYGGRRELCIIAGVHVGTHVHMHAQTRQIIRMQKKSKLNINT